MPIPQGFQRAKLEIGSPGNTVECAFNPSSYTVSKTNIWNFKPTTGTDLPDGEFGGGQADRRVGVHPIRRGRDEQGIGGHPFILRKMPPKQ